MMFNLVSVYAAGGRLSVRGRFAVPVGLRPCYKPGHDRVEP